MSSLNSKILAACPQPSQPNYITARKVGFAVASYLFFTEKKLVFITAHQAILASSNSQFVARHRVTMGCRNTLLFHNSRQAQTSDRDPVYENSKLHDSHTYISSEEVVDFCYPLLPRKTLRGIHSRAKTELNIKVMNHGSRSLAWIT